MHLIVHIPRSLQVAEELHLRLVLLFDILLQYLQLLPQFTLSGLFIVSLHPVQLRNQDFYFAPQSYNLRLLLQ